LGLSQNRLALALRVPARRINEIVLGRRRIAADTALRPARRPSYYPEPRFIAWHVREVFQASSRFQ
jgi:hypothetical protein